MQACPIEINVKSTFLAGYLGLRFVTLFARVLLPLLNAFFLDISNHLWSFLIWIITVKRENINTRIFEIIGMVFIIGIK